jgi:hypothetical protein
MFSTTVHPVSWALPKKYVILLNRTEWFKAFASRAVEECRVGITSRRNIFFNQTPSSTNSEGLYNASVISPTSRRARVDSDDEDSVVDITPESLAKRRRMGSQTCPVENRMHPAPARFINISSSTKPIDMDGYSLPGIFGSTNAPQDRQQSVEELILDPVRHRDMF